MANSEHLMGALTVTVAVIATVEVARLLRFINAAFGAWLVAAPFLLTRAVLRWRSASFSALPSSD